MRTALIAIVLCSASSAASAQSTNATTVVGLETCFKLARSDELSCSSPTKDAAQRLDCLQKAHTAQLGCLKRIPQETVAVAAPRGAQTLEPPTGSIATEVAARPAPVPPEIPHAGISRGETNEPGKLPPAAAPSQKSMAAVSSGVAGTADVRSSAKDAGWIVSETTSPVDYSPLVTATIRSPSDAKDAPNTLVVRCRGQHTELMVRTAGTWRPTRAREIQVAYQINDEPVVRLPWTASADGGSASYKNDAAGLLQSLPEGGRMNITVLDGPDRQNQATFHLAGWDAVREKIALACKWTATASRPTTTKVSSEPR